MLTPVAASFRPNAGGRARISVGHIAQTLGYSCQYVYKQPKDESKRRQNVEAVKVRIDRERKVLPRLGARKLYHLIGSQLQQQGLKMGRDGLFNLIRQYRLQIKPRKRYVQTTMSKHWMRKWPNKVKGMVVSRLDEVWLSDITYLKIEEGTMYLNLITDAFSRKIVGYALADNMETESMIPALVSALKQRQHPEYGTIHHSD